METYKSIPMKKYVIPSIIVLFMITSCNGDHDMADAYGNFESDAVMVASQGQGELVHFTVEEGQSLQSGTVVGSLDTIQLTLKEKQLLTALQTLKTKEAALEAQLDAQQVQIDNVDREYQRIVSLFNDGAATEKQLEEMQGNLRYLKAHKRTMGSQRATIGAERATILVQIDQVRDQKEKAKVVNPIDGVVLQRYKMQGELVGPGMALYKISNLDFLNLRAYVAGDQLSQVTLNQKVTVKIDGQEGLESLPGTVTWIASEAEFTPKVIQTREERVNLVYALKVKVENDGRLKIGMPGEVYFSENQ